MWIFRRFQFQRFGRGSIICNPLMISGARAISFGSGVFVREGARIEALRVSDVKGELCRIENHVSIEQFLHLTAGIHVSIGKATTISSFVYISDTAHDITPSDTSILQRQLSFAPVEIGDYCFIGTGAKILPGSSIGHHSVVGANSVVKGTFPPYSMIVGVPGRIIKTYDLTTRAWRKV